MERDEFRARNLTASRPHFETGVWQTLAAFTDGNTPGGFWCRA
jgi:hypothetical protein